MDDDGYLFIVDRMKDMIVTGGENVYSVEVENALSRHPAVVQSAVIGIPNARWGEAVHAVVVARPGSILSGDDLREHCRQFIAGYKCPKSIEFRSAMPLSATGKFSSGSCAHLTGKTRSCKLAKRPSSLTTPSPLCRMSC
ncbi:AMP-binding enzyme C-terminal domain-containing protein [Burkholderia sp. YR290]|nr:AMP-binding enzyme C-terminal domain-containing protein [Burkholderia sp. YR290]